MTIDLHGYRVVEAIRLFVESYNRQVGKGDLSAVRIIHGYGSTGEGGKIKTSLLKMLSANDGSLTFETDPVNPGATLVHPVKKLPEGAGIVAGEIIEFCFGGKTESKILGKFRQYGDLSVKTALRSLVKQGKLKTSLKGRHMIYTAS